MYVIVEIQGQQFKAEAGKFLYVHFLGEQVKEGETVEFDNVLMTIDGDAVNVGTPNVAGAKVTAKLIKNGKSKKIMVFKFKAKKNYRRRQGHRQPYTKLSIEKISV